MKRFLIVLTAVFAFTGWAAAEDKVDFKAMLAKVDYQTNFKTTDISAKVTVVSKKPGETDNVIVAQYFRRDAQDKFMILILKPEVNKGQGYLKIDKNIIFYDPESRKFSKLTGSGNFQDSNAKNSDFESSSLAEDYEIVTEAGDAAKPETKFPRKDKLANRDVWVIKLKAVKNDVTYPSQIIWIEASSNLLLKSEDYSLSNRLLRTNLYGKYISIGDRFIPQAMKFEDNLRKGEVTLVSLENPSLSTLPDSVFTKEYLEKVNN